MFRAYNTSTRNDYEDKAVRTLEEGKKGREVGTTEEKGKRCARECGLAISKKEERDGKMEKRETQATQGECLNHTGIAVSMAAGRAKRLANRNAPEINLGAYTSEQVNQLDVIGNNEQYLFF